MVEDKQTITLPVYINYLIVSAWVWLGQCSRKI